MIGTSRLPFRSRPAALSMLLLGALCGPLSCDSGSAPNPTPDDNYSNPNLISFGTNVTELTDGESVRFVALVTDSGGVDRLIGGQLTNADGTVKYGAFSASQQGAYSLDLTWAQLSQAQQLGFATEEKRTFVGEFYNTAGRPTRQTVELRFHCRGESACEGRCTRTGNLCPLSTDKLCIAGSCMAGCYVGDAFTAADAMSSADACKVCKPATSRTMLQTLPDYAVCKPGLACGSAKCEVPFTKQDPQTSSIYAVSAPTTQFQMAVGSFGTAVRTMDGGATWTSVSPGSETLRSVFALSATEIYVVGSTGTIYKTTDGGTSWTKQTSTVTSTLYGVWASGPNDVWAVGSSGTVVRTTNGGTTWTKLATPTPTTTFNAVWGSGSDDVYIVGDGGTVLRTTNSGAMFNALVTTVSTSLTGVWGSSAANVYVVGSSSTVIRTTNNGTSWTKQGTPDASSSLYGVWGSSAANIYVVGGSGLIWRSVDGGALTVVPSASFSTLYGISGTAERAFSILSSSSVFRKL